MQITQNKPAIVIALLGLALGFSIAKNYQQRLEIRHLHYHMEEARHFDFENGIHIELPVLNLDEVLSSEPSDHEADLEKETDRVKREMAQLQQEYWHPGYQ